MAVELKARLVREQRLQKRLALDELKIRDVRAVEVQEGPICLKRLRRS
jgi:hypothetical protein